jgi:UPF0755 protein
MVKYKYILILIILILISYISFQLFMPLPIKNKSLEIQIPKGATFRQAANIFEKENVLRNKTLFLIIGRLSGLDRKIRAGYYSLFSSMNLLDLLKILRNGQIIEYEITIIEGDTLSEISEKLSQKGIIDKEYFWQLSKDRDFLASFNIKSPSLEGYLFPETYKIPKGTEPRDVFAMMINKLREKFTEKLKKRSEELGMTENEVLTLASIIEKEAVTDEERPLISAVYHNRLKKKMKLQADPTSIYGVKSFKEKITYEDLKRKTPYNTYYIKGLPPGPIASPGLKSIIAALYPANVPYLYFVSNNDNTHHFSITPNEHLSAVKSYRNRKNMNQKEKTYDDKQSIFEKS